MLPFQDYTYFIKFELFRELNFLCFFFPHCLASLMIINSGENILDYPKTPELFASSVSHLLDTA